MRPKGPLEHRKGISTVIANLLMVAIVLTLATSLFIWATSSFGIYQSSAGLWFSGRSEAMRERFVVEEVWFTDAGAKVNIYVRNVGDIDITIADIYVNRTRVEAANIDPRLPRTIPIGQVWVFQITLSYPEEWNPGSVSEVVVATSRGNTMRGYWTAPA